MLPAHEETLSIQLVTNNKYARQVHSCAAGLKHLGFLDFLCKYKETCKVLLTGTECRPVTVDSLNEMIIDVETKSFSERQAHEWFLAYLNEGEDEDFPGDSRLRALLQFWTGWTIIPFGGLMRRLKVAFLPDDDDKSLPTTSSCTALLRIPTVHSSKKGFFKSMKGFFLFTAGMCKIFYMHLQQF